MMIISQKEDIKLVNNVPFVIWAYWSGKEMTGNRLLSFNLLVKNIGVPVFLVDHSNLHSLEIKEYPFHRGFKYLSWVHQSDYIRAYLLHHYGGGWHDVKATESNYIRVWDEFIRPDIYIVGKEEIKGGAAKVFDGDKWMPDYYQNLIAVTSWVGRPYTPLSEKLMKKFDDFLEENIDELKKYPAKHPRERALKGKTFLSKTIEKVKNRFTGRQNNYPLEWTLFGNLFHPVNLEYQENVSRSLPKDKVKNAGIYHR